LTALPEEHDTWPLTLTGPLGAGCDVFGDVDAFVSSTFGAFVVDPVEVPLVDAPVDAPFVDKPIGSCPPSELPVYPGFPVRDAFAPVFRSPDSGVGIGGSTSVS
jgi:hypothetical protein